MKQYFGGESDEKFLRESVRNWKKKKPEKAKAEFKMALNEAK